MKIIVLPSAKDDLADGFDFYENQGAGLGVYFMESLFSDIDSLRLYGGIHQKVFGYHRLLSKRFPYAVYYSLDSETLLVQAVLDCRRDPQRTRKKLPG
jgi:plasmid stabilization system protein ParE